VKPQHAMLNHFHDFSYHIALGVNAFVLREVEIQHIYNGEVLLSNNITDTVSIKIHHCAGSCTFITSM